MESEKKLYEIDNRLGKFYIVAESFDEAAGELKTRLDQADYGFFQYRDVPAIEHVATQKFYAGSSKQSFSDSKPNLIIAGNTGDIQCCGGELAMKREECDRLKKEIAELQGKPAERKANGVYPEEDGVRIWHDGHTFKVLKKWDKGKHALLTDEGYEKSKQNTERLQNEAEALMDWDFVGATEHIQELGTDIPLDKGEFLPTAPVYLAMYKYKDELNAALKAMGAEEIDFSEDAWFAQRYYAYHAWLFDGTSGYLYYGFDVNSAYRVRALAL